jgi:asparagine synthase (glutamine-hydrolysing)
MCGICGHTADPEGAAVASMNAAMVHRGPDDEGDYRDPAARVALGARRLSVIDVHGGHQPLSNEDGSVWAALNGEIYNHPRLKERLRSEGHRLSAETDTEVLVHLYEDYGLDMVHALEGMFAFAVWDARQRTLVLGRDRFGEKPLFYAEREGELVFASEATALLAGLPGDHELDPAAVDHFFVHGYSAGSETLLRGVRQLEPGHLLVWRRGAPVALRRYWTPPAPTRGAAAPLGELVAETGRLLDASVRSRMIADVPLGVFLSGGVDSTLVAALAARASSTPIQTFTVVYDVGDVSEVEGSRRTAQELGSDHHELLMTQAEVAARVPRVLSSLDQPLADPSLVAFEAVAEFARRHVTVAVGGEGADELFGGYPRYRWLARAARIADAVPDGLARAGAGALAAAPLPGRSRRIADVLSPRPLLERHLDWVTARRRLLRERLYGPRLTTLRGVEDLFPGAAPSLNGTGPGVARELMRLDQLHWLPGDVLAKADRASMLVSLEVRTPYLHHELAELAASVPAEMQVARDGKRLLRLLLADVMPQAAGRRPKTAFRVPVAEWLRGPLAPALRDQLDGGRMFEEGWFARDAASSAVEEHLAGTGDWGHVLWPLLSFGLWLDRLRGRG